MPAYWIARARIIDPIAFKKKYTDRSPSVIAKYGGRFLARGGRFRSWKVRTSSIVLW